MSIATSLTQIATNLTTVLNNCKTALSKWAETTPTNLNGISTAINNIADTIGEYISDDINLYYAARKSGGQPINIRRYACAYNYRIKTVTLPYADTVDTYAFYECRNLATFTAPECTFLGDRSLGVASTSNAHLSTIILGDVAGYGDISTSAFYRQGAITRVDLRRCSSVLSYNNYFPSVSDLSQITVVVPHGQLQDWIDEGWEDDGIVLEEADE